MTPAKLPRTPQPISRGSGTRKPFAEIDPDEFFDFTEVRPEVSLDGDQRPHPLAVDDLLRSCAPATIGPDLVIVRGPEPHLRWRTYIQAMVELAELLGVERVITLGAYLSEVTHNRVVPVNATSSDPRLANQHGLSPSMYEGPTGIVGVALCSVRKRPASPPCRCGPASRATRFPCLQRRRSRWFALLPGCSSARWMRRRSPLRPLSTKNGWTSSSRKTRRRRLCGPHRGDGRGRRRGTVRRRSRRGDRAFPSRRPAQLTGRLLVAVLEDCRHYVMQTVANGERTERCKLGANGNVPFSVQRAACSTEPRSTSTAAGRSATPTAEGQARSVLASAVRTSSPTATRPGRA